MNPTSSSSNRIALVDGLRGIALLGIVIAHALGWFIAGFIPESVWQSYQNSLSTTIVNYFDGIFISGKFYTFFSLLFGLSFSLQFTNRKADDTHFELRFLWRLALLFVIGFIHHIHWRGDILGIYAFLGIFLLLANFFSNRVVLILAILMSLNTPILVIRTVEYWHPSPKVSEVVAKKEQEKSNKEQLKNFQTLKAGSYTQILQQNFKDFAFKADFQWNSGRIFVTYGFFLLGLLIGRLRLFDHFQEYKKQFKKTVWACFILNIVIVTFFITLQATIPWDKLPSWFGIFSEFLFSIHSATMTIMYVAGFSLLLSKISWKGILEQLSYVGRMALTNYLLQSFVGILLFYGFGLGLAGDFNPAWCLLGAVVVFLLQILLSKWWLSRYYYGPIEWLWRSATYGKWQKMQRQKITIG
jgi:uncharacterized protein